MTIPWMQNEDFGLVDGPSSYKRHYKSSRPKKIDRFKVFHYTLIFLKSFFQRSVSP